MNNIEQFGNFMSATPIPINPPPSPTLNQLIQNNDKYIIDNNTIFKKLVDLESEIKILRNMISNIPYHQPIYHPTQPQQQFTPGMYPITNQIPMNPSIMKPNQTQFF